MDYQNIDWSKIFEKPVCQLDENGLFAYETVAELDVYAKDGSYLMPANAVETTAPEVKDGFVAKWQFDTQTWVYLPDHRGQTYYNKQTGEPFTVRMAGELPDYLTDMPKPSEHHVFDDNKGAWLIPIEVAQKLEQAQFELAKTNKLAELNAQAQIFINQVAGLDQVPEFEVQTWAIQGIEAKAWHDNPSAPTPTLDAIALARQIPADVLKQKAYEKTVKFELLTAHVAGIRQGIADKIMMTQDVDAVDAIEISFTLPDLSVSQTDSTESENTIESDATE